MARTGSKVVLNLTGADAMRHVEPGDFISHLRSFQGGFEYSQYAGKVSAAYTVLEPLPCAVPQYLKYLFKSNLYIQGLQSTTDQLRDGQSIRFAQVALLPLPVPDIETQKKIATFLDREIAEIDASIVDQEQFMGLLRERRAATISHAVQRGVTSPVALKDSCLPWLGLVPEHWSVTRVSRFFDVTLGKMLDAGREVDADSVILPYVRAANIQETGLATESVNKMPFTAAEAAELDIRQGDLLVVEGGAIGVNVYMASDLVGWSFQKTVNRVRPLSSSVNAGFLGYALDALRYGGVLDMLANKSTIAHLTAEKLERIVLAFPPMAEQSMIVRHLNREVGDLDAAIADVRQVIALLQERRAALISAVVTGGIDVQGSA
jgi:type I restriction enzyme S subunit